MQLKRLREMQETLVWPSDNSHLPVISWESCTSYSTMFLVIPDYTMYSP